MQCCSAKATKLAGQNIFGAIWVLLAAGVKASAYKAERILV
jgi:hypothetical protein